MRGLLNFLYLFKRSQTTRYKPVILVTGCSSGIGLAIAELLASQKNYRLVVTARETSLETLYAKFEENEDLWIRPLDVTDPASRLILVGEIRQKWRGVDILVNNAGISYRAVIEHMTVEDELHQFHTNYFGPTALIRAVLPHMRETGRGKIINVSSVSGMLAMPTMASYSASKHALEGLSEALWYEVKPLGINVTLVQPGFVNSKSFTRVHYTRKSDPTLSEELYSDYYEHMTPFIERLMGLSRTTPEQVAKKVLKVIQLQDPPLWVPATPDANIFYYLRRFIPRNLLLPLLFALLPKARLWANRYTHRR
ncbi:MAG: oxidoreductase [Proteobacteria bacterium SG_bin7]|nr:MAG: oxidoreductase [Proteobacteria bacterium SG_bin7]